jgi:AraC-like DNA-binding protein
MNAPAAATNRRSHAPTRGVFETSDLDLAREFFNEAHGTDVHLTGTDHEHFVRHAHYDFGSFSVNHSTIGMNTTFDVAPLESLVIFLPRSGWVEHQWEEAPELMGPGDIAAPSPPDRPYHAVVHNLDAGSIVLNRSLLMQTAGLTEDQPSSALHFTGTQPASPSLTGHWRSTVEHLRDILTLHQDAITEPLVISNLARHLAASALATFPNTGVPEPTSADGRDATPAAVRKAVAYIEANAHSDIGLADIAVAARVTPRALRMAFARHDTTSPFGRLRLARLDRAHFDLLAAGSAYPGDSTDQAGTPRDDSTVATVAARWGFATPANFAAYYHHIYGVSPSETLAT